MSDLKLIELPYIAQTRTLDIFTPLRHPTRKSSERIINMSKDEDNQASPAASNEAICEVFEDFFRRCDFHYEEVPYDIDLHNLCINEARKKGYPIDASAGNYSILKGLPVGIVLASTAYAHLRNRELQVFIALYTAFLGQIDTYFAHDISGIDHFTRHFVSGNQQANELLESLASFLRSVYDHYAGIQADIIIASALNFMTSMVLEYRTQGMKLSTAAFGYPTFCRILSGIGEAYACFVFPPDAAIGEYIQTFPELTMYINCVNDVLSFYKEENAGETVNYVSIQAAFRGKPKLAILKDLADDVATCRDRISKILEVQEEEVKAAFTAFAPGFITLHMSLNSRYHLNDLFA
ncbi:hypothetical protein NLJ89_g10818 [Agrocybe chaxingu]|uniref:Terpenoid synthase n=1 Tax=Agrocybe chaxingu TaxID=84603 RepID=A0A9W8JQ09_9AGAR|nr:hypothetical protein NLJ89_g10818 [Agrocybe chaxingu]